MILFIVPTPIGNLEDITLRALRILKEADFVLAEDTRNTVKLLKHYNIDKTGKLISHHKFNEHKALQSVIEKLMGGFSVALVSDSGTPCISDPGFLLVRECIVNNIKVECLPGPTSLIPALVNSGFPSDRFVFEGFLPVKKGRNKRLERIKDETATTIIFESPHRVVSTLKQLAGVCGRERMVCISRELTKIYEENIIGTLEESIARLEGKNIKGEHVIVLKGTGREKAE